MNPTFTCPHCGTENDMGPIVFSLAAFDMKDGKLFRERCMNVHGKGCGQVVDVLVKMNATITPFQRIEGEKHGNQ